MALYLGEASGARVLVVGTGASDATSASTQDVLADLTTHDLFPAGSGGVCLFRGLVVTLRHTQGYAIGVTPIVDGASLTEQMFSGAAPAAGQDGVTRVLAPFARRGVRLGCRLRQSDATGMVEFVNVEALFAVLRSTP